MASTTSSSKDAFKLRPLEPLNMDDWMFHHQVVMRTLGINAAFKEDRPAQDAAKLRGYLGADPAAASRPQLVNAREYIVSVKKRQRVWDRYNDRAYAYLGVACDSQQSPMEVVYAHAAAVAALPEGAPGAGQDPTAAQLLSNLAARFSQAKNIGVVQAAIAEFHSLALAPNERLESFINRLTAAMRRLHALGQTDVDLNVYCLGRLKESLAHDSRFEQIAMTLRINTRLTWEEAVEMLLSYEQTLTPGLDQTGVKTAAKGVEVPEGGEVVRCLQEEVRTLNKALLHKGAPNSAKDRGAVKGFNGKCFDCGGPHKKADCPKKGNKGGQGDTCSYCHKTGHSEKACFKKKKANQDKQADRAGVDDDFGGLAGGAYVLLLC
jgi:hypothetical protein